jgi:hypothetical protein
MIAVADLVRSLPGLLGLSVPAPGAAVDDVTLAELDRGVVGIPGDLTLGVGVDTCETATRLVGEAAARGVRAVVLRAAVAHEPEVRAAALRHQVALVDLAEHASWAHVVWLLRGLLDRTLGQGGAASGGGAAGAAPEELFAIADAAAALVGGPVTIEDAHSRVLAYSARHDDSDPARVSTIVGRRVPDAVVRHLRGRGVFRRMVASAQPFLLTSGPDAPVGSRFVIPVHAGGEWLGSIWALLSEAPEESVVSELERTAAVVALHLLQLRSQADLTRRVAMDRLRRALTDPSPDASGWLPPGPWRVVALVSTVPGGESADVARRLDLWEAVLRRHSWREPRLVDIADQAFALVRDDGVGSPTHKSPAGSWTWLRRVVTAVGADGPGLVAGAGGVAHLATDLPTSLAQAVEVAGALRAGEVGGPTATVEDAWAALTLERCASTLRERPLPSPLSTLVRTDEEEGAAYVETLTAWLDHGGATREAATTLGLHPNTVRYRMARVRTLLGVDLSDPVTRLALRLNLLALRDEGPR